MTIFTSFILSFCGVVIAIGTLLFAVRQARKKNKYSPFTEKLLRSPGYTLGQRLDDLTADIMEMYLRVTLPPIALLLVYKTLPQVTNFTAIAMVVVVIAVSTRKLFLLFKEAQTLKLGLDGEVYTGQELNFLMRQGAWVFHDIPYKYGNIDHIVVSKGGIFVVETKAVRKPAGEDGKRQSKVTASGGKLHFPHHVTQAPILQAKRHAEYVSEFLNRKTGKQYTVTPVVAIPGWFVTTGANPECLVINPKRGGGLKSFVDKAVIPNLEAEVIANHIEEFARTVESTTDRHDPDAHERYDFFLNRKNQEGKM